MRSRAASVGSRAGRTLLSLATAAALLGTVVASLIATRATAADDHTPRAASQAIFLQMTPVFLSPRCLNCHTRAAFPRQGDDRHRHTMNVARGPHDRGAAGLHCNTCHQAANQTASGVPGAPDWHLAPLRMAWDGLTPGELCRALSDPKHGAMKPTELAAHFNTGLVRWAWAPGTDAEGRKRTTPPIAHDSFVALTKRWVASGGACPN